MNSTKLKYRFPGLNSYSKEDAAIFKGRDDDSANLFAKISQYKTLVLHADSGTGKSSLIQAGLLPYIEKSEENYFPIILRLNEVVLNDSETLLVDFTQSKIKAKLNDITLEKVFLLDKEPDSFWKFSKILEKTGFKLLLIFDQFENLQTFSSVQINSFIIELYNLVNPKVPTKVFDALEKSFSSIQEDNKETFSFMNQSYLFLSKPSVAKMLFVIREDKLGVMSLLSDYFPDILKNDFIIKPLSKDDAFEALTIPANAEGKFESPVFHFESNEVAKAIIENIADSETKLVDPIQLQIVASNLEKNVVIRKGKTILAPKDIPKVNDIIVEYYHLCWNDVKKALKFNEQQFADFRKQIVPTLVVGDRRELVALEKIKVNPNCEKIVNELVVTGFLREIPYGKNIFYYQLCHDRLIEPIQIDIINIKTEEKIKEVEKKNKRRIEEDRRKAIEEAKRQKEKLIAEEANRKLEIEKLNLQRKIEAKEYENKLISFRTKRKVLLSAATIIISLILLGSFLFIREANNSNFLQKEEKVIGIVKLLRTSNPSLAMRILEDFEERYKNRTSVRYRDYIKLYDSSKYAFQTGIIPFTGNIVSLDANKNDSIITITDNYYTTRWNSKKMIIESQRRLSNGYFVEKKAIFKDGKLKNVFLVANGDSLEIQNSDGSIEKKFPLDDNGENIDISKDGNYLVIGRAIYNTINPKKPIGFLQEFNNVNDHDQMTTIFLNDSRHIAVGYWSGYKIIFRINEDHKYKVRVSKILPPDDENRNYVITSLAVDSKDKFLFAGSRNKTIEVWNIDSLECIDEICNKKLDENAYLKLIAEKMNTYEPIKVLEAHSDNITSLAISPNDSFLLSGSDDNSSILWDCKKWNKLSIIKGRPSKIKYVGFVGNDENLFTATEDELLFLWSREKATDLYKQGRLSEFSPFDYYNVGLGQDDDFLVNVYDTVTTKDYFSSTLHYILSMPLSNQHPEDADYLINLNKSLNTIKSMFNGVTRRVDFNNAISKENQKILYRYLNELEFITPDLLLKTENENDISRIIRFDKYYTSYIKQLLVDTASVDILTAVGIAKNFQRYAKFYKDSSKYKEAKVHCEKAVYLINVFYLKFNSDPSLKTILANCYGDLSFYNIFNQEYAKAIYNAERGISIDTLKNNWINTNLALGLLLNKQFKEAERIYIRFKSKSFYINRDRKFKDAFLKDFTEIEKANIVSKNDKELKTEIEKIKKLLNK